jgi:hypothetical protein
LNGNGRAVPRSQTEAAECRKPKHESERTQRVKGIAGCEKCTRGAGSEQEGSDEHQVRAG